MSANLHTESGTEARFCVRCGQAIPEARVKALPGTQTCVSCSEAGRVSGFPLITGKHTYSELQLVSPERAAELARLQDRKGSIATGVQFQPVKPPKLSNLDFE